MVREDHVLGIAEVVVTASDGVEVEGGAIREPIAQEFLGRVEPLRPFGADGQSLGEPDGHEEAGLGQIEGVREFVADHDGPVVGLRRAIGVR